MSFLVTYYYNDDFNFNDYKPPLYEFSEVLKMIFGYLVAIRIGTWYMQSRKPFSLKRVTTFHNLFLFALSLVMFLGVVINTIRTFRAGSWDSIFCGTNRNFRSGQLQFWYYVFYLSKPYEFVDTFTMVLKKKELNFLHVWHHCTTFLLVWVTQAQEMNIQWCSISANAFVHIWMYYYYFMTSLDKTVWWKRYLTLLQIWQFIITTSINFYWIYAYLKGYNCTGNLWGFFFGMFVINSFLFLFIQFYLAAYKERQKRNVPTGNTRAAGNQGNNDKKTE